MRTDAPRVGRSSCWVRRIRIERTSFWKHVEAFFLKKHVKPYVKPYEVEDFPRATSFEKSLLSMFRSDLPGLSRLPQCREMLCQGRSGRWRKQPQAGHPTSSTLIFQQHFEYVCVSENVVYYPKPNGFADQTIPMKNGYFIGNINPTCSDKPICEKYLWITWLIRFNQNLCSSIG